MESLQNLRHSHIGNSISIQDATGLSIALLRPHSDTKGNRWQYSWRGRLGRMLRAKSVSHALAQIPSTLIESATL